MIKSKIELEQRGLEIDLSGPDGNAYALLGTARRLAEQLGRDGAAITMEMRAGDYEHLLEVFAREFGDYVTIHR